MNVKISIAIGHRCQDDIMVLYHLDLDYLQFKRGIVLYSLRINICPYTRERDIMGLVDPLLVDTDIDLDDVFLATVEERDSSHPLFVVLVTLEESTLDLLARDSPPLSYSV